MKKISAYILVVLGLLIEYFGYESFLSSTQHDPVVNAGFLNASYFFGILGFILIVFGVIKLRRNE